MFTRAGAVLGILGICLATGCVRSPIPGATLDGALRLETSIRATDLQSATRVRGQFFLRNIADSAIELCELDAGVSVAAIAAASPWESGSSLVCGWRLHHVHDEHVV
jgi:hypothetical protein